MVNDLIKLLCSIMDRKLNRDSGSSEKLITNIKDNLAMTNVMLLMQAK